MAGSCHLCGECCRVVPVMDTGMSPEMRQWFKAIGATESADRQYLLLPYVCIQLNPDNTCKLHDTTEYPTACKRYHGHGNYYKPKNCGYLK